MPLQDKLLAYTTTLAETIKTNGQATIEQVWKVLQLAVVQIVQFIEENAPQDNVEYTGSDKKKAAMEAASNFYDLLYVTIEIPYLPRSIRKILHPYAKALFMKCVSGSIDATVETLKQFNFKKG